MKKIILILILSFSGMHNSYSQNAFSDAISISDNGQSYIKIIEKLLAVGSISDNMTDKQKQDLGNLKVFLGDPWNESIGKLNFKIVLEIPKIVSGFGEAKRNLEASITSLKGEIERIETDLKKIGDEIKATEEALRIPNLPQEVLDSLEKKKKELISQKESTQNIKIEKSKQIEINNTLIGNILGLNETKDWFAEFKKELKDGTEPISMLGKDNSEEVKQTVSNSNFSLSQAAIIEAIGNAIVEQLKEGLVNSLFESILDKDFQLKQTTLQSTMPGYIQRYTIKDTIAYKDGKISEKYSFLKPYYSYYQNFTFEDYVSLQDYIIYTIQYDSGGIIKTRNFTVNNKGKLKDELKIFFPKTIQVLEQLKESKTNNYFTNLNITLKSSFSDDLKNMLGNITNDDNIKKSQLFGKFFYDKDGNKMDAYNYLIVAVALIDNIKNGFHPIELIPVFENFLLKSEKFKKYATYISMIDLLQKNLRDVTQNSKNIWVNVSSLADLNTITVPGSRTSAEYFMAILYQTDRAKFKNIKDLFVPSTGFDNSKFTDFKNDLSSFIVIIRSVEKNVDELTKSNEKSFNDYAQYLDNFITLLDSTNGLVSKYFFIKDSVDAFNSYINQFKKYTNYSMQIYKSITNGTYSKILPVALEIFNEQFKEAEDSRGFKNEIVRYTNLYVDISTATSQDELNSAISKAAHNSGGYLRKSEEDFNVSIDSYPGIFLSSENINNRDGKFNFGFSVPLGFNFQFKQVGIYLQAFEIAAAVNYRVNSDSVTNLPSDVTFQQVFSPGAFFVINPFPKFPLAFNIGVSVTPALREINGSGVSLNDSKSTFYGVNISYNVPLWYLY